MDYLIYLELALSQKKSMKPNLCSYYSVKILLLFNICGHSTFM